MQVLNQCSSQLQLYVLPWYPLSTGTRDRLPNQRRHTTADILRKNQLVLHKRIYQNIRSCVLSLIGQPIASSGI